MEINRRKFLGAAVAAPVAGVAIVKAAVTGMLGTTAHAVGSCALINGVDEPELPGLDMICRKLGFLPDFYLDDILDDAKRMHRHQDNYDNDLRALKSISDNARHNIQVRRSYVKGAGQVMNPSTHYESLNAFRLQHRKLK